MKKNTFTRQHIAVGLQALGLIFISGAASHGFFSGYRSLAFLLLGVTAFVIGELIKT